MYSIVYIYIYIYIDYVNVPFFSYSDIMDSKPEYSLKFRQNRPSHQTKGRQNRTEGMMKVLTHPPINEGEWESHTEVRINKIFDME